MSSRNFNSPSNALGPSEIKSFDVPGLAKLPRAKGAGAEEEPIKLALPGASLVAPGTPDPERVKTPLEHLKHTVKDIIFNSPKLVEATVYLVGTAAVSLFVAPVKALVSGESYWKTKDDILERMVSFGQEFANKFSWCGSLLGTQEQFVWVSDSEVQDALNPLKWLGSDSLVSSGLYAVDWSVSQGMRAGYNYLNDSQISAEEFSSLERMDPTLRGIKVTADLAKAFVALVLLKRLSPDQAWRNVLWPLATAAGMGTAGVVGETWKQGESIQDVKTAEQILASTSGSLLFMGGMRGAAALATAPWKGAQARQVAANISKSVLEIVDLGDSIPDLVKNVHEARRDLLDQTSSAQAKDINRWVVMGHVLACLNSVFDAADQRIAKTSDVSYLVRGEKDGASQINYQAGQSYTLELGKDLKLEGRTELRDGALVFFIAPSSQQAFSTWLRSNAGDYVNVKDASGVAYCFSLAHGLILSTEDPNQILSTQTAEGIKKSLALYEEIQHSKQLAAGQDPSSLSGETEAKYESWLHGRVIYGFDTIRGSFDTAQPDEFERFEARQKIEAEVKAKYKQRSVSEVARRFVERGIRNLANKDLANLDSEFLLAASESDDLVKSLRHAISLADKQVRASFGSEASQGFIIDFLDRLKSALNDHASAGLKREDFSQAINASLRLLIVYSRDYSPEVWSNCLRELEQILIPLRLLCLSERELKGVFDRPEAFSGYLGKLLARFSYAEVFSQSPEELDYFTSELLIFDREVLRHDRFFCLSRFLTLKALFAAKSVDERRGIQNIFNQLTLAQGQGVSTAPSLRRFLADEDLKSGLVIQGVRLWLGTQGKTSAETTTLLNELALNNRVDTDSPVAAQSAGNLFMLDSFLVTIEKIKKGFNDIGFLAIDLQAHRALSFYTKQLIEDIRAISHGEQREALFADAAQVLAESCLGIKSADLKNYLLRIVLGGFLGAALEHFAFNQKHREYFNGLIKSLRADSRFAEAYLIQSTAFGNAPQIFSGDVSGFLIEPQSEDLTQLGAALAESFCALCLFQAMSADMVDKPDASGFSMASQIREVLTSGDLDRQCVAKLIKVLCAEGANWTVGGFKGLMRKTALVFTPLLLKLEPESRPAEIVEFMGDTILESMSQAQHDREAIVDDVVMFSCLSAFLTKGNLQEVDSMAQVYNRFSQSTDASVDSEMLTAILLSKFSLILRGLALGGREVDKYYPGALENLREISRLWGSLSRGINPLGVLLGQEKELWPVWVLIDNYTSLRADSSSLRYEVWDDGLIYARLQKLRSSSTVAELLELALKDLAQIYKSEILIEGVKTAEPFPKMSRFFAIAVAEILFRYPEVFRADITDGAPQLRDGTVETFMKDLEPLITLGLKYLAPSKGEVVREINQAFQSEEFANYLRTVRNFYAIVYAADSTHIQNKIAYFFRAETDGSPVLEDRRLILDTASGNSLTAALRRLTDDRFAQVEQSPFAATVHLLRKWNAWGLLEVYRKTGRPLASMYLLESLLAESVTKIREAKSENISALANELKALAEECRGEFNANNSPRAMLEFVNCFSTLYGEVAGRYRKLKQHKTARELVNHFRKLL